MSFPSLGAEFILVRWVLGSIFEGWTKTFWTWVKSKIVIFGAVKKRCLWFKSSSGLFWISGKNLLNLNFYFPVQIEPFYWLKSLNFLRGCLIFLSSMSCNWAEHSNIHNFLPDLHNNPFTVFKSSRLYKTKNSLVLAQIYFGPIEGHGFSAVCKFLWNCNLHLKNSNLQAATGFSEECKC